MDHFGFDYITYHTPEALMDFHEFHPNTLRTLIKLQGPWLVTVPPGYCLLAIPVPYNDITAFTATPGIIRGTQMLNTQLFWHELHGKVVIPRGTALQQYILLPDQDVQCEISDVTPETADQCLEPLRQQMQQRYGAIPEWMQAPVKMRRHHED